MKICYQCFKKYEKERHICPHCGYKESAVEDASYLIPGTILKQRYMIGKVLGAGGFGITYAAWDTVLEQRVAIKEYLPGEFSTRSPGQTRITVYTGEKAEQFQSGMEKFFEESKNLAKFRGTVGIVQIFDSFQENETVYIVMEYLDGETLEERLKRQNKLSEKESLDIMIPVLQGLMLVHKEGILHRDIAPNNIFLCKSGEVKLLDFGSARSVTGSYSKSLTVLYKEGYTAEEQYRSRGDQGPWTDVYSCAATLYRMITGVVPQGAMERRLKDELKWPSKYGRKIDKNIENAILNALNVEVEHRTKNVEQFMSELTGKVVNKNHFIRTTEKSVGRMSVIVRTGLTMISVLALLFVGLLSFGILDVAPSSSQIDIPEGKARIPNLVNVDVEEAQRKTEEAGLLLMIKEKEFSTEIPENRVLKQELRAGTLVDEGTHLSVVISAGINNMTVQEMEENGIEVVEIPDLQYQDRDEALGMLLDAGLDVKIEYETTGIVEGGKITKQNVPVGEKLLKNEKITVTVEDFVVDFTDSAFIEAVVRNVLAKESGDIWASEMLEIEEIKFWYSDIWDYSRFPVDESIAPLKNCLYLKELLLADSVELENGRPLYDSLNHYSDLDELENLVHLDLLRLDKVMIEDLDWIWRMENLTSLMAHGSIIENLSLEVAFDNPSSIQMIYTGIENLSNDSLFYNANYLHLSGETFIKIKHPEKMTELAQVWLEDVSKDAIPNIEKLPKLITLDLMNTSIEAEDLVNTNKIDELEIEGVDVTADLQKYKSQIIK